MNHLLLLILLFFGTVAVGLIPLHVPLSAKRIHQLSIYGTGLLVGAALSVIIPEGVETLYSSYGQGESHEHASKHVGIALTIGFLFMQIVDSLQPHTHSHAQIHVHSRHPSRSIPSRPPLYSSVSAPADDLEANKVLQSRSGAGSTSAMEGDDSYGDSSAWEEDPRSGANAGSPQEKSKIRSMVIGLVCHSIADGISLGASMAAAASTAAVVIAAEASSSSIHPRSTDGWMSLLSSSPATRAEPDEPDHDHDHDHSSPVSGRAGLDLIVFFAIIIHKAPAAFGFVSVLLGSTSSPSTFHHHTSPAQVGKNSYSPLPHSDAPHSSDVFPPRPRSTLFEAPHVDSTADPTATDTRDPLAYGSNSIHPPIPTSTSKSPLGTHTPPTPDSWSDSGVQLRHTHSRTSLRPLRRTSSSHSHHSLIRPLLTKSQVRQLLILFAAAAPLGAIATYFGLSLFPSSNGDLAWWTGMALLFSGGTFLFVATHVLQDAQTGEEEQVGRVMQTLLLGTGMISPLVLSTIAGGHGH